MLGLVLLLLLNFAISWANARYCGRYWSESKVMGGFFRLNVIVGYIMAIAGFTMVYGYVLLLLLPYIIPLIPELEKTIDIAELVQLTSDMLYILVATAVIPTGFWIWFQSLAQFWKRKTLDNGLTAGYNTYAQIHNVVQASREVPSAFKRVTKKLFHTDDDDNGKALLGLIVIFVVILAILGGYFTASAIMKKADREYDALKGIQ